MKQPHIRVFPTVEKVITALVDHIVDHAALAQREGRLFSMFLSGGSTPKLLYERLATSDTARRLDFSGLEFYFGDERCVPPDDERSNYRMAHEALLSKVRPAGVYRMEGEGDPAEAARRYDQLLRERFMDDGADLILLGMGDDGHTASLFPGTDALHEATRLCVANHVPHDYIPAGTNWRLTLTYPFINRAVNVAILVTGASKRDRLREVLEEDADPLVRPIRGVNPSGTLTWYLDSAAAAME